MQHRGKSLLSCSSGRCFALLLFVFTAAALNSCGEEMETTEITLNGRTFTVEIARSPEERQQGLMHRKSLETDRGMLFVFSYDQKLSFWMKNTTIPLDIAYLSADGTVKEIHQMKPLSERAVQSSHSVRYALEVPQGTFAELGIKPGYRIDLPEDL